MVDYSIDETFDLHFTEEGDFVVVDGFSEFEQDLVVRLHYGLRDVSSYARRENLERKIELLVTRVAKEFGVIDSIERLEFSNPRDKPGTLSIEVFYETGDSFTEIL